MCCSQKFFAHKFGIRFNVMKIHYNIKRILFQPGLNNFEYHKLTFFFYLQCTICREKIHFFFFNLIKLQIIG